MGMYDSFKFDGIKFPDDLFHDDVDFQTKQLACRLDEFKVTPDGRVTRKRGDREEQYWQPSNLTASLRMIGPPDVEAVFENGHLKSLGILEY